MITLKGSTQVKKAIVQQFRERVTVVRNGSRRQFMVDPIVDYETLRKLPTNKYFALKLFSQVETKLMKNPLGLAGVLDISTKLFFRRLILEYPKP